MISTSSPLQFFFYFVLTCLNPSTCLPPNAAAETNGLFVFGSSLVDNGNNNYVETTSKADYLPYGIDFPIGPSGRFSNGKNVIDVLGELLKLPYSLPVFQDPMTKGARILHGVNFASGGSGILDETGSISGGVINLNQQIRNFEEVTLPDLTSQLTSNSTQALSSYLFVFGAGGNDYLLNYFLPITINKPTLPDFTANLIHTLSGQIKKLYSMGARKFILISIYPLGCIPLIKTYFFVTQGCLEILNQVALLFNSQLKSLVDDLKLQMPGSNLVYVNTYQIIIDIIADPISKGFSDTSNACCEASLMIEGGILCKRGGSYCQNRRRYGFFDRLHPTQVVNVMITNKAYSSSLRTEAYPFNIQQLAKF